MRTRTVKNVKILQSLNDAAYLDLVWTSKTIVSRKTRAERLRWKTLCTGNDGRYCLEKSGEELSLKIQRSQTWNCFFTQTGTDSETDSTAKPQGIRTNIARAEVNVPRWQWHSWDVGACGIERQLRFHYNVTLQGASANDYYNTIVRLNRNPDLRWSASSNTPL